jgi:tRNA G37 N-methylase TrmD
MLLVLVMEMNLVNIEKYGTEKYKWVDDESVGHGGDGIKREFTLLFMTYLNLIDSMKTNNM